MVNTETIDNFVQKNKIAKIDFIKLDIEGAEYECLLGASNTIKKFKPKLAICLYHKDSDFWKLPILIKNLVSDYKVFVEHHHVNQEETVLYAVL
jgi:hypothetical protein